jgi:hypothetical protein
MHKCYVQYRNDNRGSSLGSRVDYLWNYEYEIRQAEKNQLNLVSPRL